MSKKKTHLPKWAYIARPWVNAAALTGGFLVALWWGYWWGLSIIVGLGCLEISVFIWKLFNPRQFLAKPSLHPRAVLLMLSSIAMFILAGWWANLGWDWAVLMGLGIREVAASLWKITSRIRGA